MRPHWIDHVEQTNQKRPSKEVRTTVPNAFSNKQKPPYQHTTTAICPKFRQATRRPQSEVIFYLLICLSFTSLIDEITIFKKWFAANVGLSNVEFDVVVQSRRQVKTNEGKLVRRIVKSDGEMFNQLEHGTRLLNGLCTVRVACFTISSLSLGLLLATTSHK